MMILTEKGAGYCRCRMRLKTAARMLDSRTAAITTPCPVCDSDDEHFRGQAVQRKSDRPKTQRRAWAVSGHQLAASRCVTGASPIPQTMGLYPMLKDSNCAYGIRQSICLSSTTYAE